MGLFDYLERHSKTQNENAEQAEDKQAESSSSEQQSETLSEAAPASESETESNPTSGKGSQLADALMTGDDMPDIAEVFGKPTAKAPKEDEELDSLDDESTEAQIEDTQADEAEQEDEQIEDANEASDAPEPEASEGDSNVSDVNETDVEDDAAASNLSDENSSPEAESVVCVEESAEAEPEAESADAAEEASEEAPTEKKLSRKEKKKAKKAAKEAAKSHGKHAAGTYNPPSVIPASDTASTTGEFTAIPSKKKHPVLKGFGIAACVVIVLAAAVYGAGVLVFNNRILPNTTIGEQDISLMSNDEVVQLLEATTNNYTVEAKCGSFSFKTTQADLGLSLGIESVIDNIHSKYDPLKWPLYLLEPTHDVSDALNIQFDPATYTESFTATLNEFNQNATAPVNAYIYYDENAKKFLVKDEVNGSQLDPELCLAAFTEGIRSLQPIVRFTEDELIQPTVRGTDERLIESARLASGLVSSHITLTIDGNPVRELTSAELSQGIAIDEAFQVTFNEELLNNLCDSLADSMNTIGSERTYTRADGKVITVSGGDAGWEVNNDELRTALIDAIKQAETTTVEVPFYQRGATFAERGQRDWGNRYIDVDLSEQHVRFYDDNGNLFWETACITGTPDGVHNTPQGVWSVNDTKSPSKLVGYENGKKIYETSVTFWMPFIRNSIGFHDATWQPDFGGSMFANGYGSHGCVNISYSAARELYNMIQIDDVVVTHF